MGSAVQQCRLGLCQDADFAGDLEDSKSTLGRTLCIFDWHTVVPTSWMLRMDGIPALDLWNLVIECYNFKPVA